MTWMSRPTVPMTSSTGWRGTFPPQRAGSRRGVSRKARFPELPESAAESISGLAPPAGPRYHHYVFELYALSAMLDLPADATRAQLLDAMKDIIVGKAAYVGRFRQ